MLETRINPQGKWKTILNEQEGFETLADVPLIETPS